MTTREYIFAQLMRLKLAYNLPEKPATDYYNFLCTELHARNWKTSIFTAVINTLITDSEYAKDARFGRYPTIQQFESCREKLTNVRETKFKELLMGYLAGNWWMKEELLEFMNDSEKRSIMICGGLSDMYQRTQEYHISPSKLINEICAQVKEFTIIPVQSGPQIGCECVKKITSIPE